MGSKIDRKKLRLRLKTFKARFFYNLQKTSPSLLIRLAFAVLLYLPWLLFSLIDSWLNMRRWRKVETCREFMQRHKLAFDGIDVSSLRVESKSGGVSNANQIWKCRTCDGEEVSYFVKVFVSAGSFWAKHLCLVSPFPPIYGGKTHERFTVDMISRVQLTERGIAVPKLVAFDAVEKVMVTEYLRGETVDEVLKRISLDNRVAANDAEAVKQCGVGLARIHKAGFSLIDTQPVNCLWLAEEQKVYFTDLEFCTREDKRVWDIGFFLCFFALGLSAPLKKKVTVLFIDGYQKERQMNLSGVKEIGDTLKEYLPIFRTILDIREFTPEELFEELLTA